VILVKNVGWQGSERMSAGDKHASGQQGWQFETAIEADDRFETD